MTKELVGNIVEQAIKVTSFRKVIREACRKENIPYPCDDMVAEYIEEGNPFDVNKFMDDYKSQFKTPLDKFKDEVNSVNWGNTPSDEEIVSFFNANGDNISLFVRQQNIKAMGSLERKVFLKTIGTLPTEKLVILWNTFIEESALYGEDSYIYDLSDLEDSKFLSEHMDGEQLKTISNMVIQNDTRFIQWFALNDNSINAKSEEDIKSIMSAYWSEIFERIMLYPSCYNFGVEIYCEGDGSSFFDDVVFPIIAEQVGYIIDGNKGTIKKVEK